MTLDLKRIFTLILGTKELDELNFNLTDLLPDMFHRFLENGFAAEEFPINLFGYKSGQFTRFLSDHEAALLPLVLYHTPNVATLDMLEETLDVETHVLVKRNFRTLIQLAFPGIAAKASIYIIYYEYFPFLEIYSGAVELKKKS